ncbi:MAG: hypothetical protein FJY11_10800 [Bacteroidetes bacterium]|nr:hypothetical protein [Bacteroidota bacterium]
MGLTKCDKCGVLLDERFDICPLCTPDENTEKTSVRTGEVLRAARAEAAKYAWELSGIVCLSGVVITLLLNLLFDGTVSWSLYPVTSIFWVWISLTVIVFIRRWPFMMLMMLLAGTLGMLLLFNLFDSRINWFIPVAMPVTTVLFILAGLVVHISARARYKGFNVLAVSLIAVNILCVSIEVFADLNLTGTVTIRWSAVVSAAILPIAAVLMFLHYRLKRGRRLDSFFHI